MIMGRYGLAALKKESAQVMLEKSKRIAIIQQEALYQQLELVESEKFSFQTLKKELEKEFTSVFWGKLPKEQKRIRREQIVEDLLDVEEILESFEAVIDRLNSQL